MYFDLLEFLVINSWVLSDIGRSNPKNTILCLWTTLQRLSCIDCVDSVVWYCSCFSLYYVCLLYVYYILVDVNTPVVECFDFRFDPFFTILVFFDQFHQCYDLIAFICFKSSFHCWILYCAFDFDWRCRSLVLVDSAHGVFCWYLDDWFSTWA